jgi:hypothetical protein
VRVCVYSILNHRAPLCASHLAHRQEKDRKARRIETQQVHIIWFIVNTYTETQETEEQSRGDLL